MILEYLENIVQLTANLIALLLCLFQYISTKSKAWIYATVIFLSSLLSCYYWTAYLIIMRDPPTISTFFSYIGWNIAFLVLLLLVLHMRGAEERRFFHPLMLLPIPLNLWQLSLYLPYGSVLNSVYQVTVLTAVTVFCLQSICWYWKHRRDGAARPYFALGVLLCVLGEFGMWTSTCFDAPISNLYYPFSFLESGSYLLLVWSLILNFRSQRREPGVGMEAKYQTILKLAYFAVVLISCVGGVLLGSWMRDTMSAGAELSAGSELYNIIPVILFIISLFLVAFAVAIIFLVTFSEKVAENNALREARSVAERSNAAKSDFLTNMSHEIRTPINAVLGMNEMILRESLQARDLLPRDREVIRKVFGDICGYSWNIQSAGNNLLSIINDILDFSKIEAGKLDLINADYKLSSVLSDVSNMIVFKARDKKLDFHVDVDPSLPDALYGDEIRVRQIITNVLNNAVKYTDKGGVSLSLRARGGSPAEEGQTLWLTITVRDSGIGIRDEDLGKLFQKFERVDLQKNSTVEGTGLGLAITQSLLELMGGGIEVESEYGKGSVFTITIPQKVVKAEPVGDFQEKFMKSMEQAQVRGGSFRAPDAHILVVDDTHMNLTVVVNLLKGTDLEIDTALSGTQAIALCASIRYDLILMDQRMPEMDGTEAMRRIREAEGGLNRKTPFICLTADAVIGARERYLALGFNDYLTKPIDSSALERMLLKYLPPDKVDRSRSEQRSAAEEQAELGTGTLDALRAAGIDTRSALRRCEGSADMYALLLREFAQSSGEKALDLERFCGARDWKNYAVLAHALKSSSRMIGANELSELAAEQEAAADAGREAEVLRGHADMLASAAALAELIRQELGAEPLAPGGEEEILEFLPEDR